MVKVKEVKPISLANSNLIDSDEEDEDFIASSDSESSSDSEDESNKSNKKLKLIEEPIVPALSKDDVEDLWASFNTPDEPVATTTTSTTSASNASTKKIKITTSYQFVGETVIQEKEVLADSIEAKNWLALQALKTSSLPIASTSTLPSTSAEDALFGPSSPTSLVSDSTASTSTLSLPTPLPIPTITKVGPPKRKAGGLAGLAALAKPAKLNTLEKSKLDWNKFVDKEDLSDDLIKARKDGYLEKQDFLQRTEDKREEDYDKSKALRGRR